MRTDDDRSFDGVQTDLAHDGLPASDAGAGLMTPAGRQHSPELLPTCARRRGTRMAVAGLVAVGLLAAAIPLPYQGQPAQSATQQPERQTAATEIRTADLVMPQPVTSAALAALPPATTFGTVPNAPLDLAGATAPSGLIIHPTVPVPVYGLPGGPPIAVAPPQQPVHAMSNPQPASDTWLPVVAEQPGWVHVLLPARPNSATGWIYLDDTIRTATTRYRLELTRATFTLRLLDRDTPVGQWTVGVGKPHSVTPAGRTFVVASIVDSAPTFSPIVLPLGVHSDTYQTYGGGPGTVAIHGWPTPQVFGTASSDGCVRIPADALHTLSAQIPLGTPVLIT